MTKNELINKLEQRIISIENNIECGKAHIEKLEWFKNKINNCQSVHQVLLYEKWVSELYGITLGSWAMSSLPQIDKKIEACKDIIYKVRLLETEIKELLNCINEIDENDEIKIDLFCLLCKTHLYIF